MKELTLYIKRGETIPNQLRDDIAKFVKESNKDSYEVTVKEVRDIRSAAQNRFLWGSIYPAFIDACIGQTFIVAINNKIIELDALTKDEWHAFLTEKFLRTEVKGIMHTPSTASLSVEEFSKYIDNCIHLLVNDFNGQIMETERKVYEHSLGVK